MVLVGHYIVLFLIVAALFNEDPVHVQSAMTSYGSLAMCRQLTSVMHHCVPTHRFMVASNTVPIRYTKLASTAPTHSSRSVGLCSCKHL